MGVSARVVVLVSGGMDSVTALYETRERYSVAAAVSFDYGSKHNSKELPFAAWHAHRLKISHHVIRLDFMAELFKSDLLKSGGAIPEGHYEDATMKQTVVPFRNGIMLSIAGGFAESIEANGVVIAAHEGDHAIYPDCRKEFMNAMADAVRLGTYAGIEILSPLIGQTKAQIARRGHDIGVDYSKTWSCYKGEELHCGVCGTCVERREAFLLAGIADPTKYAEAPVLPEKPPATT
jgi:7-cyano-7-deazaguanine synthase